MAKKPPMKPGAKTKTCAKCGYKVPASATKCPHCGAKV
jgi:ribosomal protein L40E